MARFTYEEVIRNIEETPRFTTAQGGRNKSGNANLSGVLELLNHPETMLPSIHIAGTNGKGSVAKMITTLLSVRGYSVGLFTSPHLVKANERIAIHHYDGDQLVCQEITDDEFVECYELVCEAMNYHVSNGGEYLSYFEYLFAIATVFYAKHRPDIVVYETGLGGRLDATNLLTPNLCVITSISLEHTRYLGNTISKIAAEKAGIVKDFTPVVYNTKNKAADQIVEHVALERVAKAVNVANTMTSINNFTDKIIDFSLQNRYYRYDNVLIQTVGKYQIDNAATAIVACNTLLGEDAYLSEEEVKLAMALFTWSGRMEYLKPNVIVDGAHNPDAIIRFVESVRDIFYDRPIRLLFAVAEDKDYTTMIETLTSGLKLKAVYITAIDSSRKVAADALGNLFRQVVRNQDYTHISEEQIFVEEDIKTAYRNGLSAVIDEDGVLLCVGSLYLVGSLKKIDAEV